MVCSFKVAFNLIKGLHRGCLATRYLNTAYQYKGMQGHKGVALTSQQSRLETACHGIHTNIGGKCDKNAQTANRDLDESDCIFETTKITPPNALA